MNTGKNLLAAIACSAVLLSCNDNKAGSQEETKKDSMETSSANPSKEKSFGKFEGAEVKQFTLKNNNGVEVKILNYGGTLTNIIVPDRSGAMGDVVLGFDSFDGYLQKGNPYFGCIVGRYGNRIANAKFKLDGKEYQLAANNNGNTLHGGLKGFDKKIWEAVMLPGDSSLQLSYTSKDGEEGYPGNLQVKVVYSLSSDNALKIDYTATTDKATPINLTNHTYWNLTGGKDSTILGNEVMINADRYTAVNNNLIPTGELPAVKGTAMDFTKPTAVGTDIAKVAGGYDHNFVLNTKGDLSQIAATVYDPNSGRFMEVYTTQPGVQFYTGNFLDGSLNGKNGMKYVQHAALCLETQHFPDSPNQPSFPTSILKPGETYHQTTIYKFSTRK